MCGIVGFSGIDSSKEQQISILKFMTDSFKHHGPDDEGHEIIGNVGLGHRRLSIIDLSPTGHQPMSTQDGQVWIVYNGEFYDYKKACVQLIDDGVTFRSTSFDNGVGPKQ